jgi:hypothetical protein
MIGTDYTGSCKSNYHTITTVFWSLDSVISIIRWQSTCMIVDSNMMLYWLHCNPTYYHWYRAIYNMSTSVLHTIIDTELFTTCLGQSCIHHLCLWTNHFLQIITKNALMGLVTFWLRLIKILSYNDPWLICFVRNGLFITSHILGFVFNVILL